MALATMDVDYCEVCGRDANPTVVLTEWYDLTVCEECCAKAQRDEAAGACVCLECLVFRTA